MLPHAPGLAASPPALYKFMAGGARRLPFFFVRGRLAREADST